MEANRGMSSCSGESWLWHSCTAGMDISVNLWLFLYIVNKLVEISDESFVDSFVINLSSH